VRVIGCILGGIIPAVKWPNMAKPVCWAAINNNELLGVVHVLGSFGGGGCYKLSPAGHGGAVVTVRPIKGVFKCQAVVYLVESVALGLVAKSLGGYGA
jgi:hypothetical protein